ncbi:MAG: hypothetical protein JXR70_16570 [Spirochaetales bacterium]|nr:hypothetical protein [Spirochaetales bacterium]
MKTILFCLIILFVSVLGFSNIGTFNYNVNDNTIENITAKQSELEMIDHRINIDIDDFEHSDFDSDFAGYTKTAFSTNTNTITVILNNSYRLKRISLGYQVSLYSPAERAIYKLEKYKDEPFTYSNVPIVIYINGIRTEIKAIYQNPDHENNRDYDVIYLFDAEIHPQQQCRIETQLYQNHKADIFDFYSIEDKHKSFYHEVNLELLSQWTKKIKLFSISINFPDELSGLINFKDNNNDFQNKGNSFIYSAKNYKANSHFLFDFDLNLQNQSVLGQAIEKCNKNNRLDILWNLLFFMQKGHHNEAIKMNKARLSTEQLRKSFFNLANYLYYSKEYLKAIWAYCSSFMFTNQALVNTIENKVAYTLSPYEEVLKEVSQFKVNGDLSYFFLQWNRKMLGFNSSNFEYNKLFEINSPYITEIKDDLKIPAKYISYNCASAIARIAKNKNQFDQAIMLSKAFGYPANKIIKPDNPVLIPFTIENKPTKGLQNKNNQIAVSLINASSTLIDPVNGEVYSAQNAFDDNDKTCWLESKKESGIGESIEIQFISKIEIDEILFKPGVFIEKYWNQNNRIKCLYINMADQVHYIDFKDTMLSKTVKFASSITTDRIVFRIMSIYKTEKWDDSGISEIKISNNNTEWELLFD